MRVQDDSQTAIWCFLSTKCKKNNEMIRFKDLLFIFCLFKPENIPIIIFTCNRLLLENANWMKTVVALF